MGKIIVIGLGPGNGRFLTRSAWDILSHAETVYLRTEKHPTIAELPNSITLKILRLFI